MDYYCQVVLKTLPCLLLFFFVYPLLPLFLEIVNEFSQSCLILVVCSTLPLSCQLIRLNLTFLIYLLLKLDPVPCLSSAALGFSSVCLVYLFLFLLLLLFCFVLFFLKFFGVFVLTGRNNKSRLGF